QQLKAAKPDLVISDITLEGKNGYELCKAIKQQAPGTSVLLLSSKQSPFDAAKGADAKADDHMDKPFDTQQMIDKVRKMLQSKGEVAGAPAPTATPAAATPSPAARPVAAAAAPAPAAATAAPTPPLGAQRAKTLIYSPAAGIPAAGIPPQSPHAPAPAMAAKPPPTQVTPPKAEPAIAHAAPPAPTPISGVPLQQRTAASHQPAAASAAAVAAHANGGMASKLEGLGLTAAQAEAVMALSREVVERVVWEVVPVLAETIIKEEIARLTK
ncbi:MAG TPA: response regulator, partial [Polyangiaceae bacterium]